MAITFPGKEFHECAMITPFLTVAGFDTMKIKTEIIF